MAYGPNKRAPDDQVLAILLGPEPSILALALTVALALRLALALT